MPRLGFSIVPLDPFSVPDQGALESVEKLCQVEFSPLFTAIRTYDKPQLIISGENEVCMTCPKCGIIDTNYQWLDLLPLYYRKPADNYKHLNFDCLMPCCNQQARILDFDFKYQSMSIEKGAGFACAEVCVEEINTRKLEFQDLITFGKIMGCPVGAIMVTS